MRPRLSSRLLTRRSSRAILTSHLRCLRASWLMLAPMTGSPLRRRLRARTTSLYVPRRKCRLTLPSSSQRSLPPSCTPRSPRKHSTSSLRIARGSHTLIEKAVLMPPASGSALLANLSLHARTSSSSGSTSEPDSSSPPPPPLPPPLPPITPRRWKRTASSGDEPSPFCFLSFSGVSPSTTRVRTGFALRFGAFPFTAAPASPADPSPPTASCS
mmetsp:Transcript_42097/g.117340  ORF Transcript_42097/g.117340 Transcript_42097/m.117340 type:complete len:214 (+) Transcript_42097:571-1212(+)